MDLSSPEVERMLRIAGEALELDDDQLERYLSEVCGENSLLRKEVLSFLKYDAPDSVLKTRSAATMPELSFDDPQSRYELQDEIARGGMGIVYRARDTTLGRDVAVKMLHTSRQDDPQFVGRFIREAEISARLQHPGIPPVYEIGRFSDGRVFISMKLIHGQTLESILSVDPNRERDLPRLIGIFEQVCQSVAYAHSRHVIHRDLKPSNIMVGEFGEVQLMDWGLAKSLNEEPASTDVPGSIDLPKDSPALVTRVGTLLGTPGYMPLEQSLGRAGKPTDVYALGAILCDILSGSLE